MKGEELFWPMRCRRDTTETDIPEALLIFLCSEHRQPKKINKTSNAVYFEAACVSSLAEEKYRTRFLILSFPRCAGDTAASERFSVALFSSDLEQNHRSVF